MVVPKVKRTNTIGIRFTKGERSDEILEKIIEDKLGIPVHELAGIMNCGLKKYMVRVRSDQMYKHLCDRYVGYTIRVDSNHEIEIDDLSSYKDRIKVMRVPFEIPTGSLKDFMSRYGKVDNVIMCSKREGKFKGVPTGEAIVWMSITTPIPSSVWIVETQTNMFTSYDNQPLTCNQCGSLFHMSDDCKVWKTIRPDDRDNAVSINIGNENVTNASGSGAQLVPEEAVTDLNGTTESSIDSSKSKLSSESDSEYEDNKEIDECEFACSECDVKCKTGHELNAHIKVHKEETYAEKAKSPQDDRTAKQSASHTDRSGFSASQPTTTTRHQAKKARENKRGASASPTAENGDKRGKKFYKVSDQEKNTKFTFYKL